ncbi:PREDICTED: uncharacterized protein LOC108359077 [Rhagoletis zephyria]|uniref:uncharacterized protein LOC108359077 n=1 Tax=Rhagoletis zephyria TaxID=28612 RepID=UPI0008116D88|nr:PREDICTED: uncharacterized protein LOC108359077 [Rhagoletis zephyria]
MIIEIGSRNPKLLIPSAFCVLPQIKHDFAAIQTNNPIPPMSDTIRDLCAKLLKERQCRETAGSQRKKRTVRSAIISNDAPPLIIKSLVDVQPVPRVDTQASSKRIETSLDQIIQQLQRDKWPPDVVVLITPASKHNNLYKLHVIDRNNECHLGMTSITQQELAELRASNVFEKYATIVGNKYIDLKTVTLNTAIIPNIMKNLNGDCCQPLRKELTLSVSLQKPNTRELVARKSSTDADPQFDLQLEPRHRRRRGITRSRNSDQYHTQSGVRLRTLIDRINDAIEPAHEDLHSFFDLAETYKFKMYIRPELCWKPLPQAAAFVRFNIECFMLFDNYVDTITINSLQLHEQLKLHPEILPRVQVIEDVCEITAMPKWLVTTMRTIAEWLRLEMFYDAFGEFLFDLYKQIS